MTIREYVETRTPELYGKKIRILDLQKKYMGTWLENDSAIVRYVKITTKYIFIFI